MRIKLLSPPSKVDFDKIYPPLGLAGVTSILRKKGHYVEQDDLQIKILKYNSENIFGKMIKTSILDKEEKIIDYLTKNKECKDIDDFTNKTLKLTSYSNFDIVGFSVLSLKQVLSTILLSKKIKEESRNTKIVIGGYMSKFLELLSKPKKQLIREIIDEKAQKNIFKEIETKKHDNLPDYSGLPLQMYSHLTKGQLVIPYQINQGCSYKCVFCTNHYLNKLTKINPKKTVDDLKILREKYQTNYFYFVTPQINSYYKELEELCDLLIDNKIKIRWFSFCSVKNMNKKILSKMRESGCFKLIYGIESGSDKVLKKMKKTFTIKDVPKILQLTQREGILTQTMVIAGFPHETKKDISKSVNFIKKHSGKIDFMTIQPFRLKYLSPMYLKPENHGIENLKELEDEKFVFSFDEINGLKWKDKKKQIIWSFEQLDKAQFKYLRKESPYLRIPFKKIIPYWFYKEMREKTTNNERLIILYQKYKQFIENPKKFY